jgi:hypothetical protein
MKVIPTYVHGILDYIVGLVLLFAPAIFGFQHIGGAAVVIPQILGAVIIVMAICTKYELGLFKLVSMKNHIVVDYVIGAFLAISPWLFGFGQFAVVVWAPHLIVGIALFMLALLSQTVPQAESVRLRQSTPRR